MPTAIRMRRGGRTHAPYYRMVVIDSRSRDRGVEIEILGYHHPCARPEPKSEIDVAKALAWLNKGAQPSDTARSVLSRLGVMKHYHDGTAPETATGVLTDGPVVDKGYNAPPPPKPRKKKEEAPAEEAAAPAETAEAAAE